MAKINDKVEIEEKVNFLRDHINISIADMKKHRENKIEKLRERYEEIWNNLNQNYINYRKSEK